MFAFFVAESFKFKCTVFPSFWLDLHIPGVSTVGGFSMYSSPSQLLKDRTLDLAVKYSRHPPALWIHEKVRISDLFELFLLLGLCRLVLCVVRSRKWRQHSCGRRLFLWPQWCHYCQLSTPAFSRWSWDQSSCFDCVWNVWIESQQQHSSALQCQDWRGTTFQGLRYNNKPRSLVLYNLLLLCLNFRDRKSSRI